MNKSIADTHKQIINSSESLAKSQKVFNYLLETLYTEDERKLFKKCFTAVIREGLKPVLKE